MKKQTGIILALLILVISFVDASSQNKVASAGKVTAKEILVKMSTTLSGFADPGAPFMESGGRDQDICYPVQFKNHIFREKPVNIDWRIVVLENEYLRVEFAPELGGMIWRLYDKVHQQDVLHAPGKVTPVADGFGGTYTPGGIEFNYPYAHSITNTWPRKTEFRENKDGSATYVLSEWERNGRTQWSMEFTLMPGESRLRQTATLYNRGKLPASFVYWGNSRVPAGPDVKWLEPEAMASEHGGSNIFTWPVFRNVDMSLMINDPEVVGMYFLEPRYNFFGLTNLKTKSGMVHYADRHDVPGKKLWNWGRTPMDGNRKWDARNESGSEPHMYGYEYGEVQSGRMVNQDHLEWLNPDECVIWHEAWSPIFGLTNVNEVTEDAAFQLLADEKKLLVYRFTRASDVSLGCFVKDKLVKEISIAGNTSALQEIDLKDIVPGDINELDVRIIKAGERSGDVSAQSRCQQKPPSQLREVPIFKESSSESLGNWAEFQHKLLYRDKALDLYNKAITADPLNYRAHLGLGKLLFANGHFKGAREHFNKSIEGYKWAGEAYLLLAQLDQIEGDLDSAEEHAYEARYYGEKSRGNIKLGEVLIARGEYKKARECLEEAVINNGRSLRTYALLALCERKSGNVKNALAQLDRTPPMYLKDILWYSEAFLAGKIDSRQLQKELFNDEWRYLDIALDYYYLGSIPEANQLADLGISIHKQGWQLDKLLDPEHIWNFTRKRETPFFYVLKGAAALKQGNTQMASDLFRQGDYFEYYVNFNQPEFIPLFEAAGKSGNGFADYWLGNFYYHALQPDKAKTEWDIANSKHPGNPQILRNLALYQEYQDKDFQSSRDLLREALKINPMDMFMRMQLAAVEKRTGATNDDILKIYLEAPKEQRDSYLHTHGLLQAFKDAGKWMEAAEYLKSADRQYSNDVKSWYQFCIEYADYLVTNSKPKEALDWIGKSAPTPANLSDVNLPPETWFRQYEYYSAARAYKLLGDKDKANEYFRKVIDEPADFLFNEHGVDRLQQQRFLALLSMKELGMDAAARSMLAEINSWRLAKGMIVLKAEYSEMKRWKEMDPLWEAPPPEE